MSNVEPLHWREKRALYSEAKDAVKPTKKQLRLLELQGGLELYQKITVALSSETWEEDLQKLLNRQSVLFDRHETRDEITSKMFDVIETLKHTNETSLDSAEKRKAAEKSRDDIAVLMGEMMKREASMPPRPPLNIVEKRSLSRREFAEKMTKIGLGAAFIGAAYTAYQKHEAKIAEETEDLQDMVYDHELSQKLDPVLALDLLAAGYFGGKVVDLMLKGEVNQYDYYSAIAFLAARCVIGGEEVTHHTVEELEFGFISAAIAIAVGFGAEGVTAQLPTILKAINGENPSRAQTVASIATSASFVSPAALTIGSCSAFGEEVRRITTETGEFNDKALGVLMGHLGDHSALGAGFISDPPDIPMMGLVGPVKMFELKAMYGQVPWAYALFSTVLKTNYLLNENAGSDRFSRSMQETMSGLNYALRATPSFLKHSLGNLGNFATFYPQGEKGLTFDSAKRMGEAFHNTRQILTKKNPACKHIFAGHHGAVSQIVGANADAMTAYAEGRLDGQARAVEEILESSPKAKDVSQIIEMTKRMIAPETTSETSLNLLKAILDKTDEIVGENKDQAKKLKAHVHALWLVSDVIQREKDTTVDNMYSLVARLTEKARLADAYGHGQMDVLTLLPWQILLSVPISNVLKFGLETVVESEMSPISATLANMGLTGVVTGTVDNLAAFLAASNASIKAKQPRLMEALMASIAFGSMTWAGNPIAHGKIASGTTHPAYGIPESIKVAPLNMDIYAATAAWTVYMNSMDMEMKILGDDHPMFKGDEQPEHGEPEEHHAQQMLMNRRDMFKKLRFG